MSTPLPNPVVQQLTLLLGAYGYNFYSDANRARADDLAVRDAVAARLGGAAAAITRLEGEHRAAYVPPSTREQPFPPASVMQSARALAALKARLGDVATRLRGLPVPSPDAFSRLRHGGAGSEAATLHALLSYDRLLIAHADDVQSAAESLTAAQWETGDAAARGALDAGLAQIEAVTRERQAALTGGRL